MLNWKVKNGCQLFIKECQPTGIRMPSHPQVPVMTQVLEVLRTWDTIIKIGIIPSKPRWLVILTALNINTNLFSCHRYLLLKLCFHLYYIKFSTLVFHVS